MDVLTILAYLSKWILVCLAVGGVIYNTIVTHVVLKNDVKHLRAEFDGFKDEIKQAIRDLQNYLMENK